MTSSDECSATSWSCVTGYLRRDIPEHQRSTRTIAMIRTGSMQQERMERDCGTRKQGHRRPGSEVPIDGGYTRFVTKMRHGSVEVASGNHFEAAVFWCALVKGRPDR